MKINLRKVLIAVISVLAAVILWLHVLTERVYEVELLFSMKVVEIPQKYILADEVPKFVRAVIRGRGKDLLAQMLAKREVVISAKRMSYGRNKISLSGDDFQLISSNLKVREVLFPKSITVRLDRRKRKEVPVKSRLVVIPSSGLIASVEPKFTPPKVSIEGPASKIDDIKNVYTIVETLRGFNTSTSVVVPLEAPMYGVKPIPDSVTAFIEVEPISQRQIKGVKVEIVDMPGRKGTINPNRITVTITGAKSDVEKVKSCDIRAIVNYNDIFVVGVDRLKPKVIAPRGVQVISTEPEYLRFTPR